MEQVTNTIDAWSTPYNLLFTIIVNKGITSVMGLCPRKRSSRLDFDKLYKPKKGGDG
jgi:hypothetical protein